MAENLKIINFKASDEDKARWKEQAYRERKSLSRWIRDQCDAGVGEPGLIGQVVQGAAPAPAPPQKRRAEVVADELLQRARSVAAPCENRVPKGAFCKRCGRIHE